MPQMLRVPGRGFRVRVYALAKQLKLDNKKVMEEARREGVDVKSPSNAIPYHVAELIRDKYLPNSEPREPTAYQSE